MYLPEMPDHQEDRIDEKGRLLSSRSQVCGCMVFSWIYIQLNLYPAMPAKCYTDRILHPIASGLKSSSWGHTIPPKWSTFKRRKYAGSFNSWKTPVSRQGKHQSILAGHPIIELLIDNSLLVQKRQLSVYIPPIWSDRIERFSIGHDRITRNGLRMVPFLSEVHVTTEDHFQLIYHVNQSKRSQPALSWKLTTISILLSGQKSSRSTDPKSENSVIFHFRQEDVILSIGTCLRAFLHIRFIHANLRFQYKLMSIVIQHHFYNIINIQILAFIVHHLVSCTGKQVSSPRSMANQFIYLQQTRKHFWHTGHKQKVRGYIMSQGMLCVQNKQQ